MGDDKNGNQFIKTPFSYSSKLPVRQDTLDFVENKSAGLMQT